MYPLHVSLTLDIKNEDLCYLNLYCSSSTKPCFLVSTNIKIALQEKYRDRYASFVRGVAEVVIQVPETSGLSKCAFRLPVQCSTPAAILSSVYPPTLFLCLNASYLGPFYPRNHLIASLLSRWHSNCVFHYVIERTESSSKPLTVLVYSGRQDRRAIRRSGKRVPMF